MEFKLPQSFQFSVGAIRKKKSPRGAKDGVSLKNHNVLWRGGGGSSRSFPLSSRLLAFATQNSCLGPPQQSQTQNLPSWYAVISSIRPPKCEFVEGDAQDDRRVPPYCCVVHALFLTIVPYSDTTTWDVWKTYRSVEALVFSECSCSFQCCSLVWLQYCRARICWMRSMPARSEER